MLDRPRDPETTDHRANTTAPIPDLNVTERPKSCSGSPCPRTQGASEERGKAKTAQHQIPTNEIGLLWTLSGTDPQHASG